MMNHALTVDLLGLFMVGTLSGGHCLLMCGGIAHLISRSESTPSKAWRKILAYNLGRIFGYTLLGGLVGAMSQFFFTAVSAPWWRMGAQIVTAAVFLLMGIYVAGWRQILLPLERIGAPLWQCVEPLTRRFLPPKHLHQALMLGLLWGFLPCGLVYGALIAALASQSAAHGALSLLAFGLGTLPNLLLIGWGFQFLNRWRSQAWFRYGSAGLLITWGGLMLLRQLIQIEN